MAKYQIKWSEVGTTSTGKTKATLTLIDEKGVETDKVTAWADFPNFAELRPGQSVSGDIQVKQNGKFVNKTLYPERTNTMSGNVTAPAWATKGPSGIKVAQERKEVMIEKAQERKSESIAYFNSCNLAIATMGPNPTQGGFDLEMFKSRRDFFLSEWEKYNQKPPF